MLNLEFESLNRGLKNKLKKLTVIEIVLLQVFFFYCFVYSDIIYTANHSLILLDCIYEGKLRSFYDIVTQRYMPPAYYDFAIYVIFAIWELPLWLVQKSGLADHSLDYLLGVLWAKTIILCFASVCLIYMWRILKLAGIDNKYSLIFFFSTDLLVTAALCLMGQYDVIPLSFILAGLYYYLNNDQKKFIFAFAIAIPIKAFAMLLFLPLLVQKEKNFLKIILKIILVLIPIVALRLLIPISVHQGGSNVSLLLGRFLSNFFVASNGRISFFVICYILLITYCYIHTFKDILYSSIVTAVFAFSIFLLLINPHPQWWIYIVPFIVILIMLNRESNVVLQLISVVGELMTFLFLVWNFKNVFNPLNLRLGVLKYAIPIDNSYEQGPANMYNAFFSKVSISPDNFYEIIISLGFVCIWLFVFLSRTKKNIMNEIIDSKSNLLFVYSLRVITVVFAYVLMFLQVKFA